MICTKFAIIWALISIQIGQASKALFYVPTLSFSHVAFNIRLAELLAQNGYDVVSQEISKLLSKIYFQTILVIDIDPNVKYGQTNKAKVIFFNFYKHFVF